MLRTISLLFSIVAFNSFGQIISGELKDSGRKLITNESFVMESHVNGFAKYEITVNESGSITGMRIIETNIKSTPARFYLENHIKKLKFEKNVLYPKFHRGIVRFTLVRSK